MRCVQNPAFRYIHDHMCAKLYFEQINHKSRFKGVEASGTPVILDRRMSVPEIP